MISLASETMYTVKDISEIYKCTGQTVRNCVDRLFPGLKENGKTTYLNEFQVSEISKELKIAHNSNLKSTLEVISTKQEEDQQILASMKILFFRQKEQQLIIESQKKEIESKDKYIEDAKPAVTFRDALIAQQRVYSMEEVAKLLKYGRNNLYSFLRTNKYLTRKNLPFSQYMNTWFVVEHTSFVDTKSRTHENTITKVTAKGLYEISLVLDKHLNKQLKFI